MAIAVQPTKEPTTKKKAVTKKRRVVVTGLGVVSPVGHAAYVFYDNLLQGVSGISEIEAFNCDQFPTKIAGEIKSFSADGWVAPKLYKRVDKFMLDLLAAAKKALEDGGVTQDVMKDLDVAKCGVLTGSALGGMKPVLTGGSGDSYVRHMLLKARSKGWSVVVFNSRGCGHGPVTTPQFYSTSFLGDISEVVAHVSSRYQDSNLYAAGWSLGANIVVR